MIRVALRGRLGSTGAADRSFYWQDGHAQDDRKAPASVRVARRYQTVPSSNSRESSAAVAYM